MDSNSALEKTEPVGLHGDEKIIARVLGVMAASTCAAVTLKSFSSEPFTITGVASANRTSAS
jgi:hypothetical protein